MRCPACSTSIPANAKFCPKCGKLAEGASLHLPRAAGALPSTGPIPRIGKMFIAALLLGLALVASGIALGNNPLLCFGLGIVAVVVLIGVIGHHVS